MTWGHFASHAEIFTDHMKGHVQIRLQGLQWLQIITDKIYIRCDDMDTADCL